jgi:hypothetical protein
MEDLSGIKSKLAALGAKIAAKTGELEQQGVLHGAARAKAARLRVQQVRLATLIEERGKGSSHADATAVLAAEAETLRLAFDRWLAEIDEGF